MKNIILVLVLAFSFQSVAADKDNAQVSVQSQAAEVVKVVAIPAASAAPLASAPAPVLVKDDSAAPPEWVQNLLVSIKSLPVIGPLAVKILNWAVTFATIITLLCGFLLGILKALSSVLNFASLNSLADKILVFQDSKFFYWLKYVAAFQKPKDNKPA